MRKALNWDLKIEEEVINKEDVIFEEFWSSNSEIKQDDEIKKEDSLIDE